MKKAIYLLVTAVLLINTIVLSVINLASATELYKTWMDFDNALTLPNSHIKQVAGTGSYDFYIEKTTADIGQSLLAVPRWYAGQSVFSTMALTSQYDVTDATGYEYIEFWFRSANRGDGGNPHKMVKFEFGSAQKAFLPDGSRVTMLPSSGASYDSKVGSGGGAESGYVWIPANYQGRVRLYLSDLKILGNLNADLTKFETIYLTIRNDYFDYTRLYIDTIRLGKSVEGYIPVTNVSLDKTQISISAGENSILTPTVYPLDASNQSVTFESADPLIATVSQNGLVAPVSLGTTIITVKTADGGYTATCTVAVVEPPFIENYNNFDFNGDLEGSVNRQTSTGKIDIIRTTEYAQTDQSIKLTPRYDSALSTESIVIINSSTGRANYAGKDGIMFWCKRTDGENTDPNHARHLNLRFQADIPARAGLTPNQNVLLTNTDGVTTDSSVLGDGTFMIPADFEGYVKIPFSIMTSYNPDVPVNSASIDRLYFNINNIDYDNTDLYVDSISIYKKIPLNTLALNKTAFELNSGGYEKLYTIFNPEDATDTLVNWSSSDIKVATVSKNGVVTAIGEGNAVITATARDTGYTANCNITVTAPDISNSNNYRLIQNFDSFTNASDYSFLSKVCQMPGNENMFDLALEDRTTSGAVNKAVRVTAKGTGTNGSGAFRIKVAQENSDLTGSTGIRFWIKTEPEKLEAPSKPRYTNFQVHLDFPSRMISKPWSVFYLTTMDGVTKTCYIDPKQCLSVPDGFEGYVSIPYDSFFLDGVGGRFDLTSASTVYVYMDTETFKGKYFLMDDVQVYNEVVKPSATKINYSSNGKKTNIIADFDDFTSVNLFKSQAGNIVETAPMECGLTTQFKDSGSQSLKIVPKGINFNGDTSGTFSMDINPDAKDWSNAEGVQFWLKTTGGTATKSGDPLYIEFQVHFDVGTRIQTKIGEPYYITYPDGTVIDDVIGSNHCMIVQDGFEGIISIPFSSFNECDPNLTRDLEHATAMYIYIDSKLYKNKDMFIDSVRTYTEDEKPIIDEGIDDYSDDTGDDLWGDDWDDDEYTEEIGDTDNTVEIRVKRTIRKAVVIPVPGDKDPPKTDWTLFLIIGIIAVVVLSGAAVTAFVLIRNKNKQKGVIEHENE